MTDDLAAINVLSQRFQDATKQLDRRTHMGHEITGLAQADPLHEQGAKVLRLYEAELAKFPNDADVKRALALHMYRMGFMYYDAYSPSLFTIDVLSKTNAGYAENACYYMLSSFHHLQTSNAALVLAHMFRGVGFYGTALYWLHQAETVSATFDNRDIVTQAKATRLELQADGKSADPPLSRKTVFPTANTAGLIVANQPVQATNPTGVQQGSQPNLNLMKGGGILGGIGVLEGMLTLGSSGILGMINIFTIAGAGLIIYAVVKGKGN